ncbi:unnamed protein product [Schistosoma rodhaini]|nr:unnamed protein product [Schistosoma rodhaini]
MRDFEIPITERRPVPWLLLSTNRLAIIRRLLGDSENFTSLNALPSGYRANICLTPFNNANINNLDILYHSRIALVCCNPSITSTSEPAQPMFIYSHGSAFTVGKLNIPLSTMRVFVQFFPNPILRFTLNALL